MWIISRIFVVKLFLVLVMVNDSPVMAADNGGPVRVWGDLSSTYRLRQSGSGDARNTNLRYTGTINGSSYIWRPWFALVNGGISMSIDETESSGQQAVKDEFTTGDLQFDLFPTSRFPFRAYYIENRNEFDNQNFDQKIATTEYGLSQQYRSTDGTDNYRAEYQNNEQDRGGQDQFVSDSLLLSGSNYFAKQTFDTDIKLDTVDNTTTGELAETYSITFDHGYGSASNFTFDNLLSSARTENDLFDSSSDVETAQLSSFMSWHPRDRRNLRLTGSMRLTETSTAEKGAAIQPEGEFETDTANANLNQGLIYEYSDNLQISESINLSSVETDGEVVSTDSESLGLRYSSDRIDSRFGDYGWSLGSTYGRLGGDVEEEESLDNQFSHSLLNNYEVSGNYQLRTNLTQSLIYDYLSNREDEKSIDHSYSATWSGSAINRQNLIRFFFSDSRRLNRDDDFFQLVNFQYTGASRVTRYSQLSGNATLQYSNQSFGGERSEQTVSNGQLEYRHNRLFRVPGLSFASVLQLSERQTETERLIQDPEEDTQMSWENSLRYRIGRLETQLDIDFVKLGNEYDYIFEFQLKRSFGDL